MKTFLTIILSLFVIVLSTLSQTIYTSTGTGGNWSATTTWDLNAIPGSGDNVIIANGTTVTVDVSFNLNNITVGQGTSGILNTSKTVALNMVVNGNILINSGATFIVQTNTLGIPSPNGGLSHTLTLYGNLTNNGSLDFRAGSSGTTLSVCNLTLFGTTTSTLNVPYISSSNGEFNYITINKTSPGKVILGSNIITAGGSSTGPAICNSGINFINGIVETGNFMLAYQGTTLAQITGASSSSYVIGTFARGMGSGGAIKDFYVGDANGYRPFYLRSTTAGGSTGHLAMVKCVSGNANTGSSTLSSDIVKVSAERYFQVSYSNSIAGNANMSFDLFKVSYDMDDGVIPGNTDLRVAYSTDNRASWTGIAQTTLHTTSPPSQITPDAITPVNLASGSSMYVALATAGSDPVPVELTSFTANTNGSNVQLNWQTATEVNNYGFEIERSNDNYDFKKIGFINGSGNSNSAKNYSFIDKKVSVGISMYRLKVFDADGRYQYTNTVETQIELPREYAISQNYPNPFNPTTRIDYQLPFDSRVTLELYGITGEKVATLINSDLSTGYYTTDVNAGELNLASGVYIYRMSAFNQAGQNFVQVKKLMLTK